MLYVTFIFLYSFSLNHSVFSQKEVPSLAWEFETVEDSLGIPQTTIYLIVNANKTLIDKGIGNFSELEKEFFTEPQYQILKNALSACTGFWAGLGHHICVLQKGNVLEVKNGFLDAESPKGTKVKFRTIKKINL